MEDWLRQDRRFVWHPFGPLTGPDPLFITSGEGATLFTADGRAILDGISSWWVNIHGHSHPVIAEAISRQAKVLEHVIFAGFTHEPAIRLAARLVDILPGNPDKVFFSDDGSTSVEVGIKMAMQFWHNRGEKRPRLIALEGAYHGDTFGAMSVGARGLFTAPWKDYLFEVDFIPYPEKGKEDQTIRKFKSLVDQGMTGAFIFEPLVQAAAGMRIYSASTLDQLLRYAHEAGVVTIADEVFTGFGRTGKLFACNYLQEQPNIVAVSKGITGGSLPLGITACSKKIVSAFEDADIAHTFFHGHSYTGNPLACAAANASLDLLLDPDCLQRIAGITIEHERFAARITGHPMIEQVRTLGTILAMELKSTGKTEYANQLREKIYPFFIERNILLRPLGNVLYVLPPYVISMKELHEIYSTIETFLEL